MPEKVVYEVPAQRIIAAALLSFAAFITVIIVVVMVVAFAVGNAGLAFSFLPLLLGFGPFVWQRLVGSMGSPQLWHMMGFGFVKGCLKRTLKRSRQGAFRRCSSPNRCCGASLVGGVPALTSLVK